MFKLMKHPGTHGYGLSLTRYDEGGTLISGFVLNVFDVKEERDKYYLDFREMTGFPDDSHLD